MAAARAGVLGVRWLQRAGRNVVPPGARTGPRERARPQCGEGMSEGWCVVGGRWVSWIPRRPCRGWGAEMEFVYPEKRVEGLAGPWKTRAPASAATAA